LIINNIHCFFYLFIIIGNPCRHFVYIRKKSSPVNRVTLTLWVQSDMLVQRRWTWLLWHCEYSLTYSIKGGEHGYSDTVSTVWHTRSKAVNMVTLILWVQSDIFVQRRWTWLLRHCEYSLTYSFKGRLNTTTYPLSPSDL
jgi:hypothetical protein